MSSRSPPPTQATSRARKPSSKSSASGRAQTTCEVAVDAHLVRVIPDHRVTYRAFGAHGRTITPWGWTRRSGVRSAHGGVRIVERTTSTLDGLLPLDG